MIKFVCWSFCVINLFLASITVTGWIFGVREEGSRSANGFRMISLTSNLQLLSLLLFPFLLLVVINQPTTPSDASGLWTPS